MVIKNGGAVKNEVLSVKVPPEIKKITSEGANFLKITQGEFVSEAVTKMIIASGYIEFLHDVCKKNGLILHDIIHESVKIESKLLFENMSSLIENFYDEYSLASDEQFEDLPVENITVDKIEEFDYIPEWEEFLTREIRDAALDRIEAEINEILSINHAHQISNPNNINSGLLFTLIPSLKKVLDVEVETQVRLFDGSYSLSTAYYLGLLVKKTKKLSSFELNYFQVFELLKSLNEKKKDNEKIWLYTFSHLIDSKFRGKISPEDEVNRFFDKIFTEEYTIFKTVKVESIVDEILKLQDLKI